MKSNHHFYDLTPNIFDIVSTLFVSPHPLYWWYDTNCIYEISSSIYVDIISIVYNNIFTIFVQHSHFTCVSHPLFPWYHTLCIYDISPTIFDNRATASVWSHSLYWCHHKNYGSHHTWHAYDIIHTVYHITFTLYDIDPQYLWHHKHCFHDIRSHLYDITSTL